MRQPVRPLLIALFLAALAGCVSKGDTDVQLAADPQGEDPTCVNLCGRVTANDPDWNGCGDFASKDRDTCRAACESVAPPVDKLRCGMMAGNCSELRARCGQLW